MQDSTSSLVNNYEQMLIKLEQDVRLHIKTEFQLKIYCESLESKIDTLERDNEKLKITNSDLCGKQEQETIASNLKINELQEVINVLLNLYSIILLLNYYSYYYIFCLFSFSSENQKIRKPNH